MPKTSDRERIKSRTTIIDGRCSYKIDDYLLFSAETICRISFLENCYQLFSNLSNPKPGHTTSGSGRGALRGGGGRAGLDANRTVRLGDKPPSYSPKHRRHVAWTTLQKHEQAKSYVNRWRNKTRGWQPVHNRFIRDLSAGREALFVPGCWPVDRRLFVSVNPFHARHVRESNKYTHSILRGQRLICLQTSSTKTCRVQNPNITRVYPFGVIGPEQDTAYLRNRLNSGTGLSQERAWHRTTKCGRPIQEPAQLRTRLLSHG